MSARRVGSCGHRGSRSAWLALGRGIGSVVLCALLVAAPLIRAQSGGGYDLHWNRSAAGGGAMSGGNGYTLNGTVAQTDATPAGALNGANGYVMHGGFWAGVHENDEIFRNGFENGP